MREATTLDDPGTEEDLVIVTRIRLPLVLSLVLFASACAHTTQPAPSEVRRPRPAVVVGETDCLPGPNRPEAPIVLVDDTGDTLRVVPETVYAYDVHPSDKSPVNVLWLTKSGKGDLRIKMNDAHCVGEVWCNPRTGLCQAKTRPVEGKGESTPCTCWSV